MTDREPFGSELRRRYDEHQAEVARMRAARQRRMAELASQEVYEIRESVLRNRDRVTPKQMREVARETASFLVGRNIRPRVILHKDSHIGAPIEIDLTPGRRRLLGYDFLRPGFSGRNFTKVWLVNCFREIVSMGEGGYYGGGVFAEDRVTTRRSGLALDQDGQLWQYNDVKTGGFIPNTGRALPPIRDSSWKGKFEEVTTDAIFFPIDGHVASDVDLRSRPYDDTLEEWRGQLVKMVTQ